MKYKPIDENKAAIIGWQESKDAETAEKLLQKLLHRFPASSSLKFHAAAVYMMLSMLYPSASGEKRDGWKRRQTELLEAVFADRSSSYWQLAVSQLASLVLSDDPEKAEQLLRELPELNVDPIRNYLILMTSDQLEPDVNRALEIGEICCKTDALFGEGEGIVQGVMMELYLRAGEYQKALDSLLQFAGTISGPVQLPNPLLFPGL